MVYVTVSTPPANPMPVARVGTYVAAGLQYFWFGIAAMVLLPLIVTAAVLVIVWIGIPALAGLLSVTRSMAMSYRRTAGRILGTPVESPYRSVEGLAVGERLRTRLTDRTTYRDLLWLPIAASLGFAVGLATSIAYLVFPVGLWASPMVHRLFASFCSVVLLPPDSERLAQRIGELSASRADTVDTQAAELRRIERDLHDGAQARLVALSMNLGLAEQLMVKDPDATKDLLAESRESVTTALSDLRTLVRGIHPPVLADRGLVGGIEALALAHPMSVETDLVLAGRTPPPVESAVYFAVAEALTNSAKHSSAADSWVWLRHEDGKLRLSVGDNGQGGATVAEGGGLHGIQRRLAAFDGVVSVVSPIGGPTIVSMEVPCELSSVRTSPSSATG